MFITRESDYAVRVIRALAGERRLSVNEICEKEELTAPFAYKILKKLQKAKIVKGFRGVHGGYTPVSYTHLDVYKRQLLTWRAHANNLYTNWLNYYVYQSTPYDLSLIHI